MNKTGVIFFNSYNFFLITDYLSSNTVASLAILVKCEVVQGTETEVSIECTRLRIISVEGVITKITMIKAFDISILIKLLTNFRRWLLNYFLYLK